MSSWKLFKLKFNRNLVHFGELGIGLESTSERARSDTLFSAWVSVYARLFGKEAVEELLQDFTTNQSEPPFRLSSTFIYRQIEGETIYYLPRPLERPINYPKEDFDFSKEYKKLHYLPLEIWHRWYQGQGWKDSDAQELIAKTKGNVTGDLDKAGTFDYGKAFESGKMPKIAVDRTTRATNLYHSGFVKYHENSGLYFIVEFSKPEFENKFLTVLNFLGDEGIGGERSSGAGQFKIEPELNLNWTKILECSGENAHSIISLFWDDSLKKDFVQNASYELQKRGGWVASSPSGSQRRRQSVQMFTEGSVFPVKPTGKLANVTPDGFKTHQVYRSGISLSLPIKVQSE